MLAAFRGAVAALAVLFAGVGSAQDLPKQHFKVLGGFSNINFARTIERPFWVQKLPEASKGSIGAEFTTLDQMGLQGTEVMRLIRLGVVDFASGNLSYMASDSPVFDSLDLPGVYLDLPSLRKSVDAYKPVLERVAAQRFNAKLLAIWPVPPQVLYCRQAISGLADLKGKKVRSFSPALADFIAAVGGTPVQIAFPEVVPSLQRGAVDCGVTGTLSGNTAKWWEVTTHLYPLVVGWAPWFTAVNLNTWNRLDARTREFLVAQYAGLEKEYWDNTAKEAQDGINCNTGQGECVFGTKGAMKLVPVSDADKATLAQVASEVVVKKWAARCGADCAREWTATVGKVVGLSADSK